MMTFGNINNSTQNFGASIGAGMSSAGSMNARVIDLGTVVLSGQQPSSRTSVNELLKRSSPRTYGFKG
jgi:hypothetical protein